MKLVTLAPTSDVEDPIYTKAEEHNLWPLDEINLTKSRFPCCLVWTPLPVVSWLAPFIGHAGLCLEDGSIVDFSGSNFVNVDNFAYGSVARYIQLDREQVQLLNFHSNSKTERTYSQFLSCHKVIVKGIRNLQFKKLTGKKTSKV